ncbi:MAG: protein kinase [Kofleriaceae bacterium]
MLGDHAREDSDLSELPLVDRGLYEIGSEVARGGMGRVITARDRRVGREVAIKELLFAEDAAKVRFEREARITAALQHPSIVPIYEVGRWDNGEPFYAMKHVDGRSLDQVIAESPQLDDRLALVPNLLAVADALAFAHSRRIVHRDIKPANILLGSFGETLVIDWGLAKQLIDDREPEPAADPRRSSSDALTLYGQVMGTRAYMPPEQARGEPIDERADVFALGATAFHVLTGVTPFSSDGDPHDVIARLPPDLLAIVRKAMARNPDDRYPTAQQLADDLRRFQRGQLVGVHRYTSWQLVRRWLRRYRVAVVVAAFAVVVLGAVVVMGVAEIVREQARADRQRLIAEDSRAEAEQLMDFMIGDLHRKLEPIGKLDLLASVAEKADNYYQRHANELDPDSERKRVQAALNFGEVLATKGDSTAALATFRDALSRSQKLAAAEPFNRMWQDRLAASHLRVANVLLSQGDLQGAVDGYRIGRGILEQLAAVDRSNTEYVRGLSIANVRLVEAFRQQGNLPASLSASRAAIASAVALVARDPTNSDFKELLSNAHTHAGDIRQASGDAAGAMAEYRDAIAIASAQLEVEPTNLDRKHNLALLHGRVGSIELVGGNVTGALADFRSMASILTRLVDIDPLDTTWRRNLATAHYQIASALRAQGAFAEAISEYRNGLTMFGELVAGDSANARHRRDQWYGHTQVGELAALLGDHQTADAAYRAALDIIDALVAQTPDGYQIERSMTHSLGAQVAQLRNDVPAALIATRLALAIDEQITAKDDTNTLAQSNVVLGYHTIGDLLLGQAKRSEALVAFRASLARAEMMAARDPNNARWQHNVAITSNAIAKVLVMKGQPKQSLAYSRKALAIDEQLLASDRTNALARRDAALGHLELGNALLALGDRTGARAAYRQAQTIGAQIANADPGDAAWRSELRRIRRAAARARERHLPSGKYARGSGSSKN